MFLGIPVGPLHEQRVFLLVPGKRWPGQSGALRAWRCRPGLTGSRSPEGGCTYMSVAPEIRSSLQKKLERMALDAGATSGPGAISTWAQNVVQARVDLGLGLDDESLAQVAESAASVLTED